MKVLPTYATCIQRLPIICCASCTTFSFLCKKMSLKTNNLMGIEIPLKTFIKEGNCCEETSAKNIKSNEVGFKDLEARIAYEEAICQNFTNQDVDKSKQLSRKIICRKRGIKTEMKSIKHISINNVTTNSIFKAIEQNDKAFLETNLHSGNVNMSDVFGWTPLMSAAYTGNLEIVEFLSKLGANRNVKDKAGLTAVQLASKNKFADIVDFLERKDMNNGRDQSSDRSQNLGKSIKKNTSKYSTSIDDKRVSESSSKKKDSVEKTDFYCTICDSEFKNTTLKQHESSIVHIFSMKPKVPEAHYMVPKGSKGYQMLINSGWNEEHGLGPSGEGRKYPVKTTLKQDRKGLGLEKKSIPKVTHFQPGDSNAVKSIRTPKQKTVKKRERQDHLRREARRERAFRKALS